MKKLMLATVIAVSAGALVAPAGAEDAPQVIDATYGASVTMTATPADVSGWTLTLGANTRSGGTLTVSANVPYNLTVVGEKATLTEYTGGAYATNPKSLTTAMVVTPTRTGGTASVPTAVTPITVGTTSGNLVTGLGGGTDEFSLQFAQTVVAGDDPLPSGSTYHNKLTYTASATL